MNVRIYVEGGGNTEVTRRVYRDSFDTFFRTYLEANGCKRQPLIVPCGSRYDAYDKFITALRQHPDDYAILLVDSESLVKASSNAWQHLKEHDGWIQPNGTVDDQVFLMVQCMETWLLYEKDMIAEFYGRNFHPKMLPVRNDVEQLACKSIISNLERASKDTKKGSYHKIRHGPQILATIDPNKVAAASPRCQRLLDLLLRLCKETAQSAAPP